MLEFSDYIKTLSQDHPPEDISIALKALWWDAKDEWDKAHQTAQNEHNPDGSWVHAYLHRKEGDAFNAEYWYTRAGKPTCHASLENEWQNIVSMLLRK